MNQQAIETLGGYRRWVASLALALGLAAPSVNAIELSLEPASTTVVPGAEIEVALFISGLGLGQAPSLGAFDLHLTFDPGVLTYDSVSFGDPTLGNQLALTFPSSEGSTFDAGAGLLNLYSVSLDSASDLDDLQADSFILASLRFTALGAGVSSLTLSDIILTDSLGAALVPDGIRGGLVEVGIVPEGRMAYPAMLLLAVSAGYTWVRQRRSGNFKG